jgi:hypothetical protein
MIKYNLVDGGVFCLVVHDVSLIFSD